MNKEKITKTNPEKFIKTVSFYYRDSLLNNPKLRSELLSGIISYLEKYPRLRRNLNKYLYINVYKYSNVTANDIIEYIIHGETIREENYIYQVKKQQRIITY